MTESRLDAVPTEYWRGTEARGLRSVAGFFRRLWALNKVAVFAGLVLAGIAIIAVLPSVFATHSPVDQSLPARFQGPSRAHWFGTDQVGRDIYSRVVHGAHLSLQAGLWSVVAGTTLGILLGLISGYSGGRLDDLIMRSLEIVLAFPGVLLAILIVATLGPSMSNVIIALVVWTVPEMARVVRSQVLSLREQDFVTAARSIGAPSSRIVFGHILPNALSPIVVVATLRVGTNILGAAALSFLGLGVPPPTPEWGRMIADGRVYLRNAPHLVTFPGLVIVATVLAVNLFGDGLDQITNPTLRNR